MQLNHEKYRHHLCSLNLSKGQENQIIELMWESMGAAAEKAWGVSAHEMIKREKNINSSLLDSVKPLDSKEQALKNSFSQTSMPVASERLH